MSLRLVSVWIGAGGIGSGSGAGFASARCASSWRIASPASARLLSAVGSP
jgi:hypothetical protein